MSMDISMGARVVVPDTVLARDLGNEIVLLHLEKEEYFGLDDVGARMWHALRKANNIDTACRSLSEEFEVAPEVLTEDLLELVRQMLEHGLVRLEPGLG